jgi:hypothetical protein
MSDPPIIYAPRPGATSQNEAVVLSNVYSFILDCSAERKAVEDHQPDGRTDGTESKEKSADRSIIPHPR